MQTKPQHRVFKSLLILLTLGLPLWAGADTPSSFLVRYNASYGSFSAESARSLQYDKAKGHYVMWAETRLTLLGSNLSKIEERSEFAWDGSSPVPLHYSYKQSGIGARTRSVEFDHDQGVLHWAVNANTGSLPMDTPIYDDLNSFMEIRRQLQQGVDLIQFQVAEKSEIKLYQYKVLDRVILDTPLGSYRTVHLERIRDPDSERTTQLWLATDMDYLLLKLKQVEPDGRLIELTAREIERDGQPVTKSR